MPRPRLLPCFVISEGVSGSTWRSTACARAGDNGGVTFSLVVGSVALMKRVGVAVAKSTQIVH